MAQLEKQTGVATAAPQTSSLAASIGGGLG